MADPSLFESDMVCRPWWKASLFTLTKRVDMDIERILMGIYYLDAGSRPRVRQALKAIAAAQSGAVLRLDSVPWPRRGLTWFKPRLSTFGNAAVSDADGDDGMQNPDTPVRTWSIRLAEAGETFTRMHVMVRLSEGVHRNLTVGILNLVPVLALVGSVAISLWLTL
jgi:hypothetical protein